MVGTLGPCKSWLAAATSVLGCPTWTRSCVVLDHHCAHALVYKDGEEGGGEGEVNASHAINVNTIRKSYFSQLLYLNFKKA